MILAYILFVSRKTPSKIGHVFSYLSEVSRKRDLSVCQKLTGTKSDESEGDGSSAPDDSDDENWEEEAEEDTQSEQDPEGVGRDSL
ncbi:hypothetical protein PF010_g23654 [Phytophthora fragariae]|uniref:Uncharacterized protein n=1 Tax=Phytophthora fragariae TaxID=53985 RepID=A0A6A3E4S6_9STRA|nr:hypothetical protein PF003_g27526 [Phytophthora fragariae]KAE8924818.1 hypothetical protein PF009_g24957 [Phytophthora fragariae]KAE8979323.1 hypothetical protein PF011_g22897 [Phytophthora fragariae]KAE9077070.1 hypothetical protein PF010_g23654 [Phytophthora fragariae]KAE9095821.1 hypothetical protein PF006_g23921 [Phytophthora fragariae]